ncbi:MAG: 2Fe-2S iron-sulfur cluster binding domain-containing protein [Rhodospirillaceae bacterium]|nr:2Fe-2S iron-sulfur cluster binding domain-containing protein [Rhodospirillaceae bacterium]
MNLTVVLPDGSARTVPCAAKGSVMDALRAAGVPVRAECGGAMACATCHVHVDAAWLAKTGRAGDEEMDLLDMSDYRAENSRLACQVKLSPALDGLVVALQLDAFEG